MITINRNDAYELNGQLEDMVEYWVTEMCNKGDMVSGETAWKLVAAYATAKEAQFAGECV